MSQVAVLNQSSASDVDVAFWVEGWNLQAREVAAAWGVDYTPVIFYSSGDDLPADCRLLVIRDTISEPGALGYHDDYGGAIYAEIALKGQASVTGSHEVLEEQADPQVSKWNPWKAGALQAVEICDRVEGDFYPMDVTVAGETRQVLVSNYLLPSAFDPNGKAPFDKLGRLATWDGMTAGGYVIVRDPSTGQTRDVFARVIPGPDAAAAVAEKLGRAGSRLLRRLRA